MTRPGSLVGAVVYMSPEQVAGGAMDARSVIFSFAVVLYEMLALRRPFVGDSALELEIPQKISQVAPAPLADDVPFPLRTMVDKALEKNPTERYQSMREMVVDMGRLLRQRQPLPGAATAPARPIRHPWWFWSLAGGALLAEDHFALRVLRASFHGFPLRDRGYGPDLSDDLMLN